MKNHGLFVAFLFVVHLGLAQSVEVATFMDYNLLNYRNSTSFCDGNNNSPLDKEGYLKTILGFVDPDIFTCNEIGNNPANASKILERCLNVDGVTKYAQASYTATSGSNLTNMLFYNTEMFTLKGQDQIKKALGGQNLIRLIDVYFLFYNDPGLPLVDTTFITVFLAHLKAGNTAADASDRADATESLMAYIQSNGISGNYIFAGDFNVYDAADVAFNNLVSGDPISRFYDPVSRMGDWNNNSQFADVHTQSTRSNFTNGGCFSGGGLDDRFDFILVSRAIKDNDDKIDYINNSYKAVGNDGNHFNSDIKNPANTSVPANVLDALYEMSDHLPVKMDVLIEEAPPNGVADIAEAPFKVDVVNPAHHQLQFSVYGESGNFDIKIWSVTGSLIASYRQYVRDGQPVQIELNPQSGIFFVELNDAMGNRQVKRVIFN